MSAVATALQLSSLGHVPSNHSPSMAAAQQSDDDDRRAQLYEHPA